MEDELMPTPSADLNGDGRWISLHNRYKREASANKKQCDVLFLGDSIINHMQFSTSWKEMLRRGIKALNFGIGGDRVEHVAWRVQDGDWLKTLEPKLVVIFVGTNNVNMPPLEISKALERLIDEVESKFDGEILLPTLLPRGEYPNPLRIQNESVNHLLRNNYENNGSSSRIHIVKLCLDGLVGSEGRMNHKIIYDYLHLTDEGYTLIFQPLFDCIYKRFEKQT